MLASVGEMGPDVGLHSGLPPVRVDEESPPVPGQLCCLLLELVGSLVRLSEGRQLVFLRQGHALVRCQREEKLGSFSIAFVVSEVLLVNRQSTVERVNEVSRSPSSYGLL